MYVATGRAGGLLLCHRRNRLATQLRTIQLVGPSDTAGAGLGEDRSTIVTVELNKPVVDDAEPKQSDKGSGSETSDPSELVIYPPDSGDTWVGLTYDIIPTGDAQRWVHDPSCGAIVTFSGTARDHSAGREAVYLLEYEAYEAQAKVRMHQVALSARERWPDIKRVVLIHRLGEVPITESAVVVAVSSPHRDAAFEAARYCIDTLKHTVPIWKKEKWAGGASWGLEAQHITGVEPEGSGAP